MRADHLTHAPSWLASSRVFLPFWLQFQRSFSSLAFVRRFSSLWFKRTDAGNVGRGAKQNIGSSLFYSRPCDLFFETHTHKCEGGVCSSTWHCAASSSTTSLFSIFFLVFVIRVGTEHTPAGSWTTSRNSFSSLSTGLSRDTMLLDIGNLLILDIVCVFLIISW